jgi:hypothetical protein
MKLNSLNLFAKSPAIQSCIYIVWGHCGLSRFHPDIVSRLDTNPETILFQCDEKAPTVCSAGDVQTAVLALLRGGMAR